MNNLLKTLLKTTAYLAAFSLFVLNLQFSHTSKAEGTMASFSANTLSAQSCEQIMYTMINTSSPPSLKDTWGSEWCCNVAVIVRKCEFGGTYSTCIADGCIEKWMPEQ